MITILLVEDDAQISNAYSFVLAKNGFSVTTAENAELALEALYKSSPNVLILDMLMPGMSGLDMLRQHDLRAQFPDMKIIGFSNVDNPTIIAEATSLGVDDYVIKVDITPSQMVEHIQQMMGKQNSPNASAA